MKISIGADHAGFEMKERVKKYLETLGHEVEDVGTHSTESTDYPPYAFRVAEAVRDGRVEGGILLCDSDFHIADVGGSAVEFKRTQTIMQGAAYCDFRYRFK